MSNTVHASPQFIGKLYGVELEIEAEGLYAVEEIFDEENDEYRNIDPDIPTGWLREHEESILGVELISDRPYPFEVSVKNIERVFSDIHRQGFKPVRTPRGSTHVHANVSDLTWDQMKHFMTACAWAEPVLIEIAGKGRKGNLFAQSYETSPIGWANAIEWCRKGEIFQNVDTHYMATSFYPMSYLGSVEFRMGPSARNATEAIYWLNVINKVVTAGREEPITDTPPEFLDSLLGYVSPHKRTRLREKASRQASEVWWGVNEPFNKTDQQTLYKTIIQPPVPVPPQGFVFDAYVSAPSMVEENTHCGDPNCTICPPPPPPAVYTAY